MLLVVKGLFSNTLALQRTLFLWRIGIAGSEVTGECGAAAEFAVGGGDGDRVWVGG